MLNAVKPSAVVTFDESGLWARVVPAVAEAAGVATLDVAHAELSAAAPLVGIGYSKVAVLGQRSASMLQAAGVVSDRIVVTGAPVYDRLFGGAQQTSSVRRRILFASQYLVGRMTAEVKRQTLLAALDFAAAAAPADFILLRHPLETDSVIDTVLAQRLVDPDVEISEGRDLYSELPGSFALVTGWSTSVLEAVIAGVPALVAQCASSVNDLGYEADGLAQGIDADNVRETVQRLSNPGDRGRLVETARRAIRPRNAGSDGRAAERVAATLLELAETPGA